MPEHRATFAQVADADGGVPSFVNEAFKRFLCCGVLAHGFARFECDGCGHDHLVPLSCKARGLCPSCGDRRMMALTRHGMHAELPYVPVRQWVLSLPFPLRYRLACNQSLCTAVHRALAGALRARMRHLGRASGHPDAQTGSVTFVQRYGGGLNLDLHLHMLGLDICSSAKGPGGTARPTSSSSPLSCGGRLRHIATILDGGVARKILEHLGLPARAPPVSAAVEPPPFWQVAQPA